MVGVSELERIALRYDTAMSRAMLKALGSRARPRREQGARRGGRYRGMGWCFQNASSPLDLLR